MKGSRQSLLAFSLVCCVTSAWAQQLPGPAAASANAAGADKSIAAALSKIQAAMVDLSVADSPAFTVLGLTPEDISRPTTARKLATSLLNGVDRNGILQSGVAVDTAPYLAVAGHLVELGEYRRRYPLRFASRLQLSLATTKASSEEDNAIRAALGFRVTIFDFGDPRTDAGLERCFDERPRLPQRPDFVIPPPPESNDPKELAEWATAFQRGTEAERQFNAAVESYVARVNAAVTECRQQTRTTAWNNSKWIVAAAPAWTSATGAFSDLDPSGGGLWTTLVYGFERFPALEDAAQLLVHARYRDNEKVSVGGDTPIFVSRDMWLVGAQFRAGTADQSVEFEVLWERTRPPEGAFTSDGRMSVGYERRIAPNLWLGVAIGGQASPPIGTEQKGGFFLSSLKWGFAERSTLGSPVPE
jgi:hypothetical protein